MDLDELAGRELERRAVRAFEREVAHAGRQHVAVGKLELEVLDHGPFGTWPCRRNFYNRGCPLIPLRPTLLPPCPQAPLPAPFRRSKSSTCARPIRMASRR